MTMKKVFRNIGLKAFLQENKKTILTLFIFSIFAEIFSTITSFDLFIFIALILYIVFIVLFKLKNSFTIFLCIALLLVMSISYLFTDASISTEKAAVWFILFLIVAVIQQWKK